MRTTLITLVILLAVSGCQHRSPASAASIREQREGRSEIHIGPFDESQFIQHQRWIQDELDKAEDAPTTFVFSPGEYSITNPEGLRVPSGATVIAEGARFSLIAAIGSDGQAFLIEDASHITWKGGEILGARDRWDPGVNVAGLRIQGECQDISISGLKCRNLSANSVGVFGESDDNPIRDISLIRVSGTNCCNYYGDYLSDKKGPAPGSDRKDQGTVALYHVDGWLVDGCQFADSQSDGTHFYHSHNGRFVNNVVSGSQMGGYFLEGCDYVVASGNIINDNGSRGVTIERNSQYCILNNNIIRFSGREGLWAPEVQGILVQGNVFHENGRKDDGQRDCEIRLDNSDAYEVNTDAIRIENNLFYSSPHQTAVLFMGKGMNGRVVMQDNTFTGEAPKRVDERTKGPAKRR